MAGGSNPEPSALTLEIAARLRAQIGRLNTSASAVGREVGMSQSAMSRILNGQKPIYVEQLELICEALSLDLVQLVGDSDRATRVSVVASAAVNDDFDVDPASFPGAELLDEDPADINSRV